jgi:hypothetical protein
MHSRGQLGDAGLHVRVEALGRHAREDAGDRRPFLDRPRGLGAWRFRGLPEPIDLFQVQAADLPADFPPPRSATPAK